MALQGLILSIDYDTNLKEKNIEDLIENADGEISNTVTKKVRILVRVCLTRRSRLLL